MQQDAPSLWRSGTATFEHVRVAVTAAMWWAAACARSLLMIAAYQEVTQARRCSRKVEETIKVLHMATCRSRGSAISALPARPRDFRHGVACLLLPEALRAHVFAMAGLPALQHAAVCNKLSFEWLWQNQHFWHALVQAMELDRDCLTDALGNAAPHLLSMRDALRHHHFGISRLLSVGEAAAMSGPSLPCSLKEARQAVLALQPQDGPLMIARVVASVAVLLRRPHCHHLQRRQARELLEAAAQKQNIFTNEQLLRLLGAFQEAQQDAFFRKELLQCRPPEMQGVLAY
mmetsp:Transcript_22897/g.53586  ORF Transcript_22897/g.53586 Transcript_22897/m.53586 type:complete len:289 (+) Transcript_22897:107-973(+)